LVNLKYVLVGELTSEHILLPTGQPMLNTPGGSVLYSMGGLGTWDTGGGLLARIGEDYPREWLRSIEQRGFNTDGVRIIPEALGLRSFLAYSGSFGPNWTNPVAHFTQLGIPFQKTLLGYQSPIDRKVNLNQPDPAAPHMTDIPSEYLNASAVHICPIDFLNQSQLLVTFRQATVTTLTLDPSPGCMNSSFLGNLRTHLEGLTAFLPSQEELRLLFWGKTNDLWEMAEALGAYGCELIIVKCGGRGQLLYDAITKRRWEVPAYPARVTDPTGVGDAFCGGFLAGFRQTYDPLHAVLYGNVSASLCIEGSGPFYAMDVLPGLAQARRKLLSEIVRMV
jgi:hypothetical protein